MTQPEKSKEERIKEMKARTAGLLFTESSTADINTRILQILYILEEMIEERKKKQRN